MLRPTGTMKDRDVWEMMQSALAAKQASGIAGFAAWRLPCTPQLVAKVAAKGPMKGACVAKDMGHAPTATNFLSTRAYEEPCWHYKSRNHFPRSWCMSESFCNSRRPDTSPDIPLHIVSHGIVRSQHDCMSSSRTLVVLSNLMMCE